VNNPSVAASSPVCLQDGEFFWVGLSSFASAVSLMFFAIPPDQSSLLTIIFLSLLLF